MLTACAGCAPPGGALFDQVISRRALLTASALLVGLGAAGAAGARGAAARGASAGGSGPADTIFRRGTIVTVGGAHAQVEAMAVRDGRIVAVGEQESVLAWRGPSTTIVDLDGRTVLPGFFEPHLHTLNTALAQAAVDVSPFTTATFTEAMQKLKSAVDAAQPGQWVTAWGYDPTLIAGPPGITVQDLDQLAPNNPVFVLHISEHIAYLNSLAFAAAGVTKDTPNPPGGGRFLHDASGNLTGQVEEAPALLMITAKIPPPPPARMLSLLDRQFRTIAAAGCTTIVDAGLGANIGADEVALYEGFLHRPGNQLRMRAYPFGSLLDEFLKLPEFRPMAGDDLFRMVKVKFISDGSSQGLTAALKQPYLNGAGSGALDYSLDQLKAGIGRAIGLGWPVSVHCNGDAALEQALDAFDALQLSPEQRALRHRIEHFTVNEEGQVERAHRLGLTPSFTIGHVHYWGKVFFDQLFGPARASRIDPTMSWIRRGAPFSLHSDSITTPVAPLSYIQTAVTRRMQDGGAVLGPEQRIPVDEAIKAVTLYAAWQVHMDGIVGSLEVGKYADLVALEQDPRAVDPDTIGSIKVAETWLAGQRQHGA